MGLDDLFDGEKSDKGRRGSRREREEAVKASGEEDLASELPEHHRPLLKQKVPFAVSTKSGRLRQGSKAPGASGLDDLGKSKDPRRAKASTSDKDFRSASEWGRFKPKR